ncbi:MAG: NADH-quinone oxidoreductase subunit NuoE [Armatimonadota bacterium]|nr:NADH-quinone oxidoreductase subunit NuoE [Armatimonadota bacterium]MDR7533182.1 NADH-quinone oxidoreductase subunit NuoE [Armatimonadota bacterium]MDR7535430.1 NADH-quinone oxidoreductase subunit NuoE [Armatimonadota bacterium]
MSAARLPAGAPRAGGRPLSEAARREIRRLAARYEHRQSALLPALFVAQAEYGWLPPEALDGVAAALDLPLAEVASVASFYHLFYLEPVGRHVIQVCTNVSCMLAGCSAVVRRLHERLGVGPGGTTPDGRFTWRAAECLAACEEAPVVLIDEDRWPRVGPAAVDELLARYP